MHKKQPGYPGCFLSIILDNCAQFLYTESRGNFIPYTISKGAFLMKKFLALILAALILSTCMAFASFGDQAEETVIPDGIYRGSFTDPKQVEVEFEIKDNTFVQFKFRSLTFKEMNYLKNDDAKIQAVGQQYVDLGNYLVGKDFSALKDLYTPGNIASDVDGFTAATVRSSKVISAINDAVARKPYKLTDTTSFTLDTYQDGTYRGAYLDSTQIQVEFVLKDNVFESVKLRTLGFKGSDYLKSEDAAMQGIAKQYTECTDYLVGKDVSAIMDLYAPENVASDVDGFTAATMRSSKLISSIFDALNRGVYKLADSTEINYDRAYEDGTYRGAYLNPSEVEIEFVLKDNVIESIRFRALAHKGINYLKSENELENKLANQYQAVIDYLVGKPLSAIKDTYTPGDFVEDIDGFTGATVRSSKIISAINDALTRGAYKLAE